MKQWITIIATLVLTTLVAASESDGKRWWATVDALANDSMKGRNTGSPEHRKAADYVITQFEHAGLKPTGAQGFLQPVAFNGRRIVESQSSLELVHNGKAER